MGADLYIEKLFRPQHNKVRPKFQKACKARDKFYESHGGDAHRTATYGNEEYKRLQKEVDKWYNLLYDVGYFRDSYNESSVLWQLGLSWWKDVGALLNKKRNLSGANLKKFRQMVADAPLKTEDYPGDDPECKGWYKRQKEELLKFLDTAIKARLSIHCSI